MGHELKGLGQGGVYVDGVGEVGHCETKVTEVKRTDLAGGFPSSILTPTIPPIVSNETSSTVRMTVVDIGRMRMAVDQRCMDVGMGVR